MVFWIFGYGSLVWNPGFQYDEKVIGYIKDYKRVFDLACIDHRGTPEHPARTCTLEYSEGSICWGAVYCVRGGPEKERAAMEYLERRECEYDHKIHVDFFKEGEDTEPLISEVIVFMSTPDKVSNKYYLGPAPLDEMAKYGKMLMTLQSSLLPHHNYTSSNYDYEESSRAFFCGFRQIASAFGPCGNNRDYLFLLEKAMHDLGHEDNMVIELANEVRKVLGVGGRGVPKEKLVTATPHIPIKSPIPSLSAVAMDS